MKVSVRKPVAQQPPPSGTAEPIAQTMTMERPALWHALPGWGIAADLTPPELINARQLKVLRWWMAAGLVVLLVVCAGGYYLAARDRSSATAELTVVQDQTRELQVVGRSYSGVIAIQGSVKQIETQVAQVMSADVDVVALLVVLQSSLPKTMTINQEAITISTAGVAGTAGTAGTSTGSSQDSSGLPRIGTITIGGTGRTLDDLSDYIDSLQAVPGLVDVLPVSNTAAGKGTQFSLTIGLTNALLSHRFDVDGG